MEENAPEQVRSATPVNATPVPPKSPAARLAMRSATSSPRSASKTNGFTAIATSAPASGTTPTPSAPAATTAAAANASETAAKEPTPDAMITPKSPHVNGNKPDVDDADAESELSEPDSNVHSPEGVHELAGEIVVSNRDDRDLASSPLHLQSEDEDETMIDAAHESPYPKRRRAATYADDGSARSPVNGQARSPGKTLPTRAKPGKRQSVSGVKGVTIGYWRDAPVPQEERKHSVIGFIDVRDRLRTRIQPHNLLGEHINLEYALPGGPGGSWVTFDRIVFLQHLIGMDQTQVKEYVRIRAEASPIPDKEERAAAEQAAAEEARARVRYNPEENAPPIHIARGLVIPHEDSPRPEAKRRKTTHGFSSLDSVSQVDRARPSSQPVSVRQLDALHGTRPTRILLGYWTKSTEAREEDRHAVYGILGHNDMFRVKLVRETRDGRYVDGNFPQGAGALWIPYEEVVFEDFLRGLERQEIKEYCRVRQYQIDHGENPADRESNEAKARVEAEARVGFLAGKPNVTLSIFSEKPANDMLAPAIAQPDLSGVVNGAVQEVRTSRRNEARLQAQDSTPHQDRAYLPQRGSRADMVRNEGRPEVRTRRSTGGYDTPTLGRSQGREKTTALAQREISRAEEAQNRADQYVSHRERATARAMEEADAAATVASAAATSAAPPRPNGMLTASLQATQSLSRLNNVWARQENLRTRAAGDDVKIYDGRKYERKTQGPFVGKLVSSGSLITIDNEDFIEYRVLMGTSFC